MKLKLTVVVLVAVCASLAVALIFVRHQAGQQQRDSASAIIDFSNQLVDTRQHLDEANQVNLTLNSDVATNREINDALSNQLVGAQASLQGAQDEITGLNSRITGLESQNEELDQRVTALTNDISSLDTQISLTQTKLALTETNNTFLQAELKRQVAQRAELERKFSDLNIVRAQVKQLKTDLIVSRRLEWMREGIDPSKITKGGEVLMQRTPPAANTAAATAKSNADKIPPPLGTNFDLNVEISSDGSVQVIPATNVPPQDTPAQAAARAALLKVMNDTNAPAQPAQ